MVIKAKKRDGEKDRKETKDGRKKPDDDQEDCFGDDMEAEDGVGGLATGTASSGGLSAAPPGDALANVAAVAVASVPVADDRPLTAGTFRDMFRSLMSEGLKEIRSEVSDVRTQVTAVRRDMGKLTSRVSALEQQRGVVPSVPSGSGGASSCASPVVGAPPAQAADLVAPPPPALAAPASRELPVRLEFTNCHDFQNRMAEAFDEMGALAFLKSLTAALPLSLQQCLLPEREQARRNSRALVFVPVLLVKPGLNTDTRDALMEALRTSLSSGAFDRFGRRPRVRWELRQDQRPLNKLIGLTYRLTEGLAKEHPTLARWKVQPAGQSVEFWLLRDGARPVLMGKVGEGNVLSNVGNLDGVIAAARIMELWHSIASLS